MALTLFLLAYLMNTGYELAATSVTGSSGKPVDSKRRHDIVDETFLEQKDILLDMLESKLKEVRDKKKKKSDRSEINLEGTKCESLPSNVDLKLKANGLSAIGEADVSLKFGNSGKGTLNLDANGISNVGKARLDLGVGDGGIYIPGLNNLFVGKSFINNCEKEKNETEAASKTQNFGNDMLDFRRSGDKEKPNEDTNKKGNNTQTTDHKKNDVESNNNSTVVHDLMNVTTVATTIIENKNNTTNSTVPVTETTKP